MSKPPPLPDSLFASLYAKEDYELYYSQYMFSVPFQIQLHNRHLAIGVGCNTYRYGIDERVTLEFIVRVVPPVHGGPHSMLLRIEKATYMQDEPKRKLQLGGFVTLCNPWVAPAYHAFFEDERNKGIVDEN